MREQPFLDQILDAAGHKWRAAVLILRRQFLPEPCHGAIEVMQGRRLRQGLHEQYGERGVGRYRLPIGSQRDVPDKEWLRQPHPSQEAERPRYARNDAAGQ